MGFFVVLFTILGEGGDEEGGLKGHNMTLLFWADRKFFSLVRYHNQRPFAKYHFQRCCGSATFCYESGSADDLRIRILLFSSEADKMPTKNNFFFFKFFCLLLFGSVFTSAFKVKRIHKIVEINVFLYFFACWWKDPDRTNNGSSGSGRTKNIRIRIHNTDFGKHGKSVFVFLIFILSCFKYKEKFKCLKIGQQGT